MSEELKPEVLETVNETLDVAQEASQETVEEVKEEVKEVVEEVKEAVVNFGEKTLAELSGLLQELTESADRMKRSKEAEAIKSAFYKRLSREKAEAGEDATVDEPDAEFPRHVAQDARLSEPRRAPYHQRRQRTRHFGVRRQRIQLHLQQLFQFLARHAVVKVKCECFVILLCHLPVPFLYNLISNIRANNNTC